MSDEGQTPSRRSTRSGLSGSGSSPVVSLLGTGRRVNIVNRGGDQRSIASGVAPFSPASSLGLASLSPASRTNNSPRGRPRGGKNRIRKSVRFEW